MWLIVLANVLSITNLAYVIVIWLKFKYNKTFYNFMHGRSHTHPLSLSHMHRHTPLHTYTHRFCIFTVSIFTIGEFTAYTRQQQKLSNNTCHWQTIGSRFKPACSSWYTGCKLTKTCIQTFILKLNCCFI